MDILKCHSITAFGPNGIATINDISQCCGGEHHGRSTSAMGPGSWVETAKATNHSCSIEHEIGQLEEALLP
jgi:hypothetical protein